MYEKVCLLSYGAMAYFAYLCICYLMATVSSLKRVFFVYLCVCYLIALVYSLKRMCFAYQCVVILLP